MSSTFHTYPDLVHTGGRLACTEWDHAVTAAELIAATLRRDPKSIILRVAAVDGYLKGLAPGGLG
jgi:hypothetical protein